jgi:putative membrane protein
MADASRSQAPKAGQSDGSERTEFAAERTVLAIERTYAAWVRTGLAALVSGLAVLRFMREVLTNPALLALSLMLLTFAVVSFTIGAWRYVRVGGSFTETEIRRIQPRLVVAATLLLVAAGLIGAGSALVLW